MGGQVEYYFATPEYPVLTYNLEENVGLTLNRLLLIVSVSSKYAVDTQAAAPSLAERCKLGHASARRRSCDRWPPPALRCSPSRPRLVKAVSEPIEVTSWPAWIKADWAKV